MTGRKELSEVDGAGTLAPTVLVTISEISRTLGISRASVMRALRSGLEKIKRHLSKEWAE